MGTNDDRLFVQSRGPIAKNHKAVVGNVSKQSSPACRFIGRISNPDGDVFEKLMNFGQNNCTYFVAGQIEMCSYLKNASEWIRGAETTPHVHFYFETSTICRWTKFQKPDMLGKGPHLENAKQPAKECIDYTLKDGVASLESGGAGQCARNDRTERIAAFAGRASEGGQASAKKRSDELVDAFEKYKSVQEMMSEAPAIYARNCHGINAVYQQRLREKHCDKPVIYWHFGDTRSGKTYSGLEQVGGKDNHAGCHFQVGNTQWMKGGYNGQPMIMYNEFRKSSMEDFCNLLTVMEGFPADQPVKGGFTPVRINKLVITCPRPPATMTVFGAHGPKVYEGEFSYFNAATNEKRPFEDVDQVIERIRESGGALIYHYRTGYIGHYEYHSVDVTNYNVLSMHGDVLSE